MSVLPLITNDYLTDYLPPVAAAVMARLVGKVEQQPALPVVEGADGRREPRVLQQKVLRVQVGLAVALPTVEVAADVLVDPRAVGGARLNARHAADRLAGAHGPAELGAQAELRDAILGRRLDVEEGAA